MEKLVYFRLFHTLCFTHGVIKTLSTSHMVRLKVYVMEGMYLASGKL